MISCYLVLNRTQKILICCNVLPWIFTDYPKAKSFGEYLKCVLPNISILKVFHFSGLMCNIRIIFYPVSVHCCPLREKVAIEKLVQNKHFKPQQNSTSAAQPSSSPTEFIKGVVLQKSSWCILSE